MQKIPENTLIVLKVFLPLFLIIILFVIVGKFGFGKTSDLRNEISSAQNDQSTLTQKLEILKNIKSTGEQLSNITVSALPDSNPSLAVVSQIKILAGMNGLVVSSIKASSPQVAAGGFSSVSISFNILGPRNQIESFVNKVGSIAPITIVDKIKISETAPGSSVGSISIKSFWMPFPTKIPAVTQAISDLTPDERQTLQDLRNLTQPVFNQVPAAEGGKGDPFSQ